MHIDDRHTRSAVWALVAALAVVCPRTSWGQQPDPAAEARARYQEGLRSFQAGQWGAARAAFEDAYRLAPNALVLANIAECQQSEGRPDLALWTYRRFLAESELQAPERVRAEVRRTVQRLRSTVGEVTVAVEPEGAQVSVDGEALASAPLPFPIALRPGEHAIEVRAEGRLPATRVVTVAAGQVSALAITLEREEPTPARREPEPPPEPDVVPPPLTPPPPPDPEAPRSRDLTMLWVGGGLTAALAVGATVTGVVTLGELGEYEAAGTSLERRRSLYDSIHAWSDVTDVLVWSAVGAALTTGLFLILSDGDDAPAERVACRPSSPSPCDLRLRF